MSILDKILRRRSRAELIEDVAIANSMQDRWRAEYEAKRTESDLMRSALIKAEEQLLPLQGSLDTTTAKRDAAYKSCETVRAELKNQDKVIEGLRAENQKARSDTWLSKVRSGDGNWSMATTKPYDPRNPFDPTGASCPKT